MSLSFLVLDTVIFVFPPVFFFFSFMRGKTDLETTGFIVKEKHCWDSIRLDIIRSLCRRSGETPASLTARMFPVIQTVLQA